jgi:hypothetical protein
MEARFSRMEAQRMNPQRSDCCAHSGYYSGVGLYSKDARMLRYVLICDECGEEMKELLAQEYAPKPLFERAV